MLEVLPQAVQENRTAANRESADDALRYVSDSLQCFHLYQAHRVRVVNQRIGIEKEAKTIIEEVLKTKQKSKRALVVVDFKQKYLETRLRSSQQNDFGQRGMTWHICVLEYYDYVAPCKANGCKERAARVQVPLDQLLDTGNKQDSTCVLSMLEAMLRMVDTELPWIHQLCLLSDNAICYHGKEVIFSIAFLNNFTRNAKIVKYLHSETQDGKAAADSHAAVAGRHVDTHFIKTRKYGTVSYNQACTPKEVATALCCNGGVQNSGKFALQNDD